MDRFHKVLYAVFLSASVAAVLTAAVGYIVLKTTITP